MSFVSRLIGARRRTVVLEEEALACLRRGDVVAARELADRALALAPRAAEVHQLSGRVAMAEQRFDAAAAHLQTAIAAEPDSISMRFDFAEALRQSDRAVESLDAYQSVLRASPEHPGALLGLAEALADSGDREGARDTLARARGALSSAQGAGTEARAARIEALNTRLATPGGQQGTT
jgi:tetratricopeptide (TPR) repeat protein